MEPSSSFWREKDERHKEKKRYRRKGSLKTLSEKIEKEISYKNAERQRKDPTKFKPKM